jgi:hypothetical protein
MKVFIESQRFDQWWFRLLALFAVTISVLTTVMAYPKLQSEPPAFWISLFASVFTSIIFVSLVFLVKLETKIDELGIQYSFWPFHMKLKVIRWSDIEECYVIKYSPIIDYGGWGYKMGIFRKKGSAMSVRGNIGIQLVFKSGKQLLIGTQKKEDAEKVLETYTHKIS